VKVGQTIDVVHSTTMDLADHLRTVAERHATDHAVYHVGRMLAGRCEQTASTLEPFAERYQQDLNDDGESPFGDLGERLRRGAAAAMGRRPETGLLLLRDLRDLATEAHGVHMDWTVLRQGASVARDQPLLDVAMVGQDEMKRVTSWLTTRIKESAPQVMAG
jgi:hypothetical protein